MYIHKKKVTERNPHAGTLSACHYILMTYMLYKQNVDIYGVGQLL